MTYLRLLNVQGIAGVAVAVCLALLLVIQKGETRHWKKQAGQFEQLYLQERTAFSGTVANYRAAAEAARADDRPPRSAFAPSKPRSTKGATMTFKLALPALALALTSCANSPKVQPIPAVAEARQCPTYPLPPAELIKPPAKTDFLPHYHWRRPPRHRAGDPARRTDQMGEGAGGG